MTPQQADFIERFLKVPKLFKRKEMKERRKAAAEDFRLFNTELDLVREEIMGIDDPAMRSMLLAQLAAAEKVIEQDPENLDFAGGHQQLADVQAAIVLHTRKADAERAFGQLETAIGRMEKDHPLVLRGGGADAQSDIALTWAWIEEKYRSGMAANNPADLDSALRAMGRLEVMMRDAVRAAENPFETRLAEVGDAKAAAQDSLGAEVRQARQSLLDTFNQLAALRDKLTAIFGEGHVPLAFSMGATALKAKLDAAVDAVPGDLPGMAEDAGGDMAKLRKQAEKTFAQAEVWRRDLEAFAVRYAVMKAHPQRAEPLFVKPEFDKVTAAYRAARAKAEGHEYAQASTDLAVVRHDLKDALDFADDHANYAALVTEREQLLATLPAPASLPFDNLREDHAAATKLLADAKQAHQARQMTAALALLNQIPGAVADLLALNRFAKEYKRDEKTWKRRQARFAANYASEIQTLLEDDIAYCLRAGEAAQADAARGELRSAAGQFRKLLGYQRKVLNQADYLKGYLAERAVFAARLEETKVRKGPEGRIAIESYYQALQGDEAKRASAEAKGDFKLANAMCQRLKPQHAEMLALADQAKAYLAEKTTFDAELAKLSGKTTAAALEAKSTAEEMLANAVAATVRGNWLAATNLLENAVLEIKRAVDDLETAELIDGLQSDSVALSASSDFGEVYAVFARAHDHASGLDTEGWFAEDLAAAERTARSVEALMKDDLNRAQSTLNDAIEACKTIALKVTATRSYGAQRAALDTVIAQAEAAKADGVIDAEIETAEKARDDAEALAEGPGNDLAGAIKRLGEGQAAARLGIDAMALYKSAVRTARRKVQESLTAFARPAHAPKLIAYAERLQGEVDKMNAAFDNRKLAEAATLAEKVTELEAAYRSTFQDYQTAERYIADNVRGKQGIEMTHASTTEEALEITRLTATMDELHAKGSFAASLHTAKQVKSLMSKARKKAGAFDQYLLVKVACEKELDKLELRATPDAGPAQEAIAELRRAFDAALEKESLQNYGGAEKSLQGFLSSCQEAAAAMDVYDRCLLQKTRAEKALARVQERRSPAVEPLLTRLEGKDANAGRRLAAFDFAAATDLFVELQDDCAAALTAAERTEDLGEAINEIKVIAEDDLDALLAAIDSAEARLDEQSREPSAMYVHPEIMEALGLLSTARDQAAESFADARRDLEKGVDACLQIVLLLAQYDQLNASAKVARDLAQALRKDHPLRKKAGHADVARDEIDARMTALEVSMNAARAAKSNRAQTQTDIEDTITALRELRHVLDAHLDYVTTREPAEERLAELEKGEHRHLIREDLTEARRGLDTAATRAADRNHKSAGTEVKAANVWLDMAALRIKLAKNAAPTPEELKAILAAPDGLDKIDGIVAGLEADTQRKVMATAFEARFGCKLKVNKAGGTDRNGVAASEQDMEKPALNIRKFYEAMSKLPPSDTLDNDSLLTFIYLDDKASSSSYSSGEKRIAMREGDDRNSRIYAIAIEHEIGKLHDSAIPKAGEERTAFSWNTLHEVGHAVDDKLGYMNKHGERLAGWKVYGADVTEAATAIAGKFDFDADYIAEYMLSAEGRKLPIPDPVGCDFHEWRRRMEECRMFVDRARHGNKPWSSASVAAACAIGRHTYVESYDKKWARYLTEARQYGVSGYQFRAPGEWFSEIYAALHSDRLNDSHPHKTEFESL
ncbi:hypothetical protein AB2B41_19055 [Marimonas sp. MJW-29]|uniref:Uncharacterized protein n=1 Tax=Sulfitobacter sediminis TaxID=3234186 RepID=A0ABV3RRT0_9RHOB